MNKKRTRKMSKGRGEAAGGAHTGWHRQQIVRLFGLFEYIHRPHGVTSLSPFDSSVLANKLRLEKASLQVKLCRSKWERLQGKSVEQGLGVCVEV